MTDPPAREAFVGQRLEVLVTRWRYAEDEHRGTGWQPVYTWPGHGSFHWYWRTTEDGPALAFRRPGDDAAHDAYVSEWRTR